MGVEDDPRTFPPGVTSGLDLRRTLPSFFELDVIAGMPQAFPRTLRSEVKSWRRDGALREDGIAVRLCNPQAGTREHINRNALALTKAAAVTDEGSTPSGSTQDERVVVQPGLTNDRPAPPWGRLGFDGQRGAE